MPSPEELVGQFFKRFDEKPSRYVTLPYIRGITDALRRILLKQNIRVTTRPLNALQRMFPAPKHQVPPDQRTNVIYNIPCSDCPWSYVVETGRSFQTRKKEHISGNYRTRKTLESWHTATITNSDNNSKPLPKKYATLVLKICNR